jgi:hypothetical protein
MIDMHKRVHSSELKIHGQYQVVKYGLGTNTVMFMLAKYGKGDETRVTI